MFEIAIVPESECNIPTVISSSYEIVESEPPPQEVTDNAREAVVNPAKRRLEIRMNLFKLINLPFFYILEVVRYLANFFG